MPTVSLHPKNSFLTLNLYVLVNLIPHDDAFCRDISLMHFLVLDEKRRNISSGERKKCKENWNQGNFMVV